MRHKKIIAIAPNPVFNIPTTAFNYGSEVEELLQHHLYPETPTDISSLIRNMNKEPYVFCAKNIRDLGNQANLTKDCLIYPAGGFDIFIPHFLHHSQHIISISKEPFGSPNHFRHVFKEYKKDDISSILTGSLTFDTWSRYTVEDHSVCGLSALIRANILLNYTIQGLHYFTLSDHGIPIFLTIDKPSKQHFQNAVLSLTNLNGENRKFWYFSEDLLGSNQNLMNFIARLDFDLLIKASLNLFDKRVFRQAYVRDFLICRAKILDSQIFTDIPPTTTSLNSFWRKSPKIISLPKDFEFGYSNDQQRFVFCGSAHLAS
ncbi:MAG: hypothetical protein AABZ14_07570 [Candidatus Margulisiibacteriota bacterium]